MKFRAYSAVALVAAAGLILTGCDDKNSQSKGQTGSSSTASTESGDNAEIQEALDQRLADAAVVLRVSMDMNQHNRVRATAEQNGEVYNMPGLWCEPGESVRVSAANERSAPLQVEGDAGNDVTGSKTKRWLKWAEAKRFLVLKEYKFFNPAAINKCHFFTDGRSGNERTFTLAQFKAQSLSSSRYDADITGFGKISAYFVRFSIQTDTKFPNTVGPASLTGTAHVYRRPDSGKMEVIDIQADQSVVVHANI